MEIIGLFLAGLIGGFCTGRAIIAVFCIFICTLAVNHQPLTTCVGLIWGIIFTQIVTGLALYGVFSLYELRWYHLQHNPVFWTFFVIATIWGYLNHLTKVSYFHNLLFKKA